MIQTTSACKILKEKAVNFEESVFTQNSILWRKIKYCGDL